MSENGETCRSVPSKARDDVPKMSGLVYNPKIFSFLSLRRKENKFPFKRLESESFDQFFFLLKRNHTN